MRTTRKLHTAVLLATYNGSRYLYSQIESLKENETSFVLHWLDDHSTDDTRLLVRDAAARFNIPLKEWHQPVHIGVPGSFFQLVESVEADIYLFCDQDDIWQAGKIDTTVKQLTLNLDAPFLCFSDPLIFEEHRPGVFRRFSDFAGKPVDVLEESRLFFPTCASGHTQGFTRPLREIFLKHKDIARSYAWMHDCWMYNLAVALGGVQMLLDVPTTLWRQHRDSATRNLFDLGETWIARNWMFAQYHRGAIAKQARGFVLAAETLPAGVRVARLLELAQVISRIDRRQSLSTLVDLTRRKALWPKWSGWAWFMVASLFSDAAVPEKEEC
jgi:rhamnosyltransferase